MNMQIYIRCSFVKEVRKSSDITIVQIYKKKQVVNKSNRKKNKQNNNKTLNCE